MGCVFFLIFLPSLLEHVKFFGAILLVFLMLRASHRPITGRCRKVFRYHATYIVKQGDRVSAIFLRILRKNLGKLANSHAY